MINSRTFRARTVRVHSPNRIEVDLDLDFGSRLKRTFLIEGLVLNDVPEALRQDAKHCLVVLVGGKNLVVRPNPRERDRWHRISDLHARVYLRDVDVHGEPVGYVPGGVPESSGPVLEVGPYMSWLQSQGFDVERVKETMNGCPRNVS